MLLNNVNIPISICFFTIKPENTLDSSVADPEPFDGDPDPTFIFFYS